MVVYGLYILPLTQELRKAHPSVTTFEGIRFHIDDLMVQGPQRGYFQEPTKSVMVVSPHNVPRTEAFFRGYGLQILTGSRYLGGFVGSKEKQYF